MGVNDHFEGTFEITTSVLKKGCAVACKICPQELLVSKYLPHKNLNFLSFDDFVKILAKVPKTYRIDFAGYSEPFLNKDCGKMMKHACDSGYRVCCYTTLVGANLDDVELLASLPFSRSDSCPLVIHVPDSGDIMPVKITKRYRAVLKSIIEKNLRFVGFMTMDKTGDPHPDIIDLVGKLKDFKAISRANNIKENEEIKEVKRLSGRIMCKPMPKLNHNILLPNGDVQLCCMDYGLKHKLGNLLESSHTDLFKGKEFKRIRKNMIKDMGSSNDDILCRNCELAMRV